MSTRGHQSTESDEGWALRPRTEQVRAALADATRASVSQWGKCAKATTIAQLVWRFWRLPARSLPAEARSTAPDGSSVAPGRPVHDQGQPREQVSARQRRTDNRRA